MKPDEFFEKLKEIHGDKIYHKRWPNYPRSFFYYDHPNPSGADEEIGIYTGENNWYIKESADSAPKDND